jgi:hypothetical protein
MWQLMHMMLDRQLGHASRSLPKTDAVSLRFPLNSREILPVNSSCRVLASSPEEEAAEGQERET